MIELRVLDSITRQMQRLGYLKRLVHKVNSTSTSSLENLGQDLITTVTRRFPVPLTEDLLFYVRKRLFDKSYESIRNQADGWRNENHETLILKFEIQDLYLSDPKLPSGVGKLVKNDWRRYSNFGINLGLIRSGTYSINTRALTFLSLISNPELNAFLEYTPEHNPFILNDKQALLLLYALLENDGEIAIPLWKELNYDELGVFHERDAGNLLPEIYEKVIARHRGRLLSYDMRDRLQTLEKSAESIAKMRKIDDRSGRTAREEAIRPRLEPYTDLGIFSKPNPLQYKYHFSRSGLIWLDNLQGVEDSNSITEFLQSKFFQSAALAMRIPGDIATSPSIILPHLYKASKSIASPGGYAPIVELALLAGIEGLIEHQLIIEYRIAREILIAYQKENPYHIRFTVDRMGTLAHARFMEDPEIL